MISSFVSPISKTVFMDYEIKAKARFKKADEVDKKNPSKANSN